MVRIHLPQVYIRLNSLEKDGSHGPLLLSSPRRLYRFQHIYGSSIAIKYKYPNCENSFCIRKVSIYRNKNAI